MTFREFIRESIRIAAEPPPPWLHIHVKPGGWWHRVLIAAGARERTPPLR